MSGSIARSAGAASLALAILCPEQRPFFLENSGLFTVGAAARGGGGAGDLDLFFSRRIGLDEDGNLVPIVGGARISGKANGYNVGLLNMQTDAVAQRPGNNFNVARVSRDLPSRSGVGVMFINRSATGDLAGDGNWNRTWGLDSRLGVGERLFVVYNDTESLEGAGPVNRAFIVKSAVRSTAMSKERGAPLAMRSYD